MSASAPTSSVKLRLKPLHRCPQLDSLVGLRRSFTATLRGFEGQVLAIVDIADPANPKTAGMWWHPGQHTAAGETYTPEDQRKLSAGRPYPQHGLSLHGGAYALGDRAYCPWMRGG